MKLRAQLILAFWALAVVPLAVVTLYSYRSSLKALHSVAEQEASSMASDMSVRMENVSRDINHQIEMFAAAVEVRKVMELDEKSRSKAMQALAARLRKQMGENASFVRSVQFAPAGMPPPPFPPAKGGMTERENTGGSLRIHLGNAGPVPGPENAFRWQPPPFSGEQFYREVRSGSQVVGKVRAEISSQRLLFNVLRRTQPRQGEIPYAVDAEGKLYATNPADLEKLKSLPLPKPVKGTSAQQVTKLSNWVLVTRKDAHSGLSFGIARPLGDRLGELRQTTVRNLGYGLLVVVLAMAGIFPLSRRMTRNLAALARETENLARGDFNARVHVATRDEFGQLAQAFNRMAEDISEHQKDLIERERILKELEMCRSIQEELLPRGPLRSGIAEVKGVSIPAREVGGDFFNYFPLVDGQMALLVGDVSGKGLPAALLMANLQATIQARLPLELDLVRLAGQLDNEIMTNNAEAYLTLFIAVLDPRSLMLRYVNAGHNPQLLLKADGSVLRLQSTGRPVGLLAGGGFEETSILLGGGDELFFYTDGLVETVNAAGEEFGMERLERLLIQERALGVEGLLAKIEATVGEFRGNIEAADDATLMLLKINGAQHLT